MPYFKHLQCSGWLQLKCSIIPITPCDNSLSYNDCLRDLCHRPAKSMRSDQHVVRLPYITKYTRSNVFVGFFSAQVINSRSFREELCIVSWMTNSPSNVALAQILMRSSLLNEQFYLCGYIKCFIVREVSTFEIKGWKNMNGSRMT